MSSRSFSYSQSQHEAGIFTQLFSTSYWSSIIVTVLSVLFIVGVSLPLIRLNLLPGEAEVFQQALSVPPLNKLQIYATQLGESHAAANLSLFLFWGIVGIAAYWSLMGGVRLVGETVNFDKQLHYVHTKPMVFIREVCVRLGIRIVVAAVWLLYAWVFSHLLVPYVAAASGIAAGAFPSLLSIGYFMLGFAVIWLGLHVHVMFFRLLALRTTSDVTTD